MSDTRDYASGPTFFALYERNGISEEDIDDFIHYWHADAPRGAQPLHEFLGLTWNEYALWATEPDALAEISAARRTGRPIGHRPRAAMKKTA